MTTTEVQSKKISFLQTLTKWEVSFQHWFEEIKSDFHKITWTQQKELFFLVQLVIGCAFVAGFAVFFVDYFLQNILSRLLGAV